MTVCSRPPVWIRSGILGAAAWAASASILPAQGPPAVPVRYTEVREYPVQGSIRLPGTVESRSVSLVASEVAGLVAELPAREGDTVLRDQVLERLRTSDLKLRLQAVSAQLREAESRLKLAELSLERARELFESRVMSQQQLDDVYFETSAWKGRVEQYTAEMARVQLDIERSEIRSPFAGVVVAERTEVGQWIRVGDPVVEILSLADLEIRVEVPERHYHNLTSGAEATVTFEALQGLEIAGRVSAIIPRADPQSRIFPLKVRIPNREGRIGVGMLAQVTLPAGESYRATVVPKDAVVSQGNDRIVYLINGDIISAVPVETGAGVGSWIVVQGAVQAGQKVVTRGNERLFPGQAVQGEPLEYALP